MPILSIIVNTVDSLNHLIEVSDETTGIQLKKYITIRIPLGLKPEEMELEYDSRDQCDHISKYLINNDQKLSILKLTTGKWHTFHQQKIGLAKEDPISGELVSAKMPCGHPMGRDCMTQFIRSLIDAQKYQIKCPHKDKNLLGCLMEWDFAICKKIGVFTTKEMQQFEEGFSRNWIKNFTKECPKCKQTIFKGDLNTIRVACPKCKFDYCYNCGLKWKVGKFCGNPECQFVNEFLQKAPYNRQFWLRETKGATGLKKYLLPQYRACPNVNCMAIIEHVEKCKHIDCKGCTKKFCWVCLEVLNGTWKCGEAYDYCGKIAPTQHFKLGN